MGFQFSRNGKRKSSEPGLTTNSCAMFNKNSVLLVQDFSGKCPLEVVGSLIKAGCSKKQMIDDTLNRRNLYAGCSGAINDFPRCRWRRLLVLLLNGPKMTKPGNLAALLNTNTNATAAILFERLSVNRLRIRHNSPDHFFHAK